MNRFRKICLNLVLAGGMGLAACALTPEAPSTSAGERTVRREILAALRAREEAVRTIRAVATVSLSSRLVKGRSESVLFLRRPHELRIDGLSPFGYYDFQLAVAKGDLAIYWGGSNRYVKQMATRETLAQYLSISLQPEEAVVLLATLVPLEADEDYEARIGKRGETVVLRGRNSLLRMVRAEEGYQLKEFTALDVDGSPRYRIRFSGFQPVGGVPFPREVSAWFRDPRRRVLVRYRSVELNVPLTRSDFDLAIPDDAEPL